MRKLHLFALAALLPLAACGRDEPPAAAPASAGDAQATAAPADTALGRKIQEAMAEASRKLATENVSVGGRNMKGMHFGDKSTTANLPRAEMTPQGDLLIDGKAVTVDAKQRELLLAHRAQVIAIAQAGIAIGMRGADLGVKAATGALQSVFSGTTDDFEKRMEAEGKRMEAEANKLCTLMPGLLASQQALAAALPEFKPYATMDQADVDDCGKDGDFDFGDDAGTTTAAAEEAATDTGENSGDHTRNAAAEADAAARGSSTKQ
jgi:hypothetical protein